MLDRWKMLLALSVSLKVKCFSWLLFRDRLAIKEIVFHFGLIQDEGSTCPICGEDREDIHHIFIQCSRIYRLWARVTNLWVLNFVGDRRCVIKFRHLVSYNAKRA